MDKCIVRLKISPRDLVIANNILRKFGYSIDEYLKLAIVKLIRRRGL